VPRGWTATHRVLDYTLRGACLFLRVVFCGPSFRKTLMYSVSPRLHEQIMNMSLPPYVVLLMVDFNDEIKYRLYSVVRCTSRSKKAFFIVPSTPFLVESASSHRLDINEPIFLGSICGLELASFFLSCICLRKDLRQPACSILPSDRVSPLNE
jgi:hypothetical protein